jgi:GDP-D-mannose 3', 5'-epimerase
MTTRIDALVTGGGGFIGGHLVGSLLAEGLSVRSVDVKPIESWYQHFDDAENIVADASLLETCRTISQGVSSVYNLAADMGGMGFIENNKALCMLSVLVGTHMLMAAKESHADSFFFSSSACVYAAEKQTRSDIVALTESDAYPAMPEDGYGWEKLFTERMCRHFYEDFGLQTRVARYHNVYGPDGTWDGGREKAPAAICRKVATAALTGRNEIEIWGDGEQSRSFMYIDDCIYGTKLIAQGNSPEPVNLGSNELVTINQLVSLVEEIAGLKLERKYNLNAPKGVQGRNSDNTMMDAIYGWSPSTSLASGLKRTYEWVYEQVASSPVRAN